MNTKKACAGRRKPFSGFGGFRVFGSAEAESINAVSRQKRTALSPLRAAAQKRKKPSRCRRPERNMRLRCCRIFALRRNGSLWRACPISARTRPRRRPFAPLYIRRFVKKPVKGRRAKAVESPIVCALHPRDAAAFFPCHSGAFLLCPFFLGHQRHSAGLRNRRNALAVFV